VFLEEREQAIVARLQQYGKVTVESLAEALGVSAPTVRGDLARLEGRGLLRRTHGGAIIESRLAYEPSYAERSVLNHEAKQLIAKQAASLVKDGHTVLLDAGTTCFEIAKQLSQYSRLTVVTNSISSAHVLAQTCGIDVIIIGGNLQLAREATLGPLACSFLSAISCDIAFVAVNGVHEEVGYTVADFEAAALKTAMLNSSVSKVIVADSTKIGKVAFASIGKLPSADILISDRGLTAEQREMLTTGGVETLISD
jgi:DeoR family fructose operon transcriptional repressor